MATNHVRCVPPTKLNKYYINQSKGGYSLNIMRNERDGYVLPNCTGYASGKFNEEYNRLMGLPDGLTFKYFRFDASNFMWQVKEGHYKDILEYGMTPKVAGIMVWDDRNHIGHVAIVDEVFSDGTIRICESNYHGAEYRSEIISNSNGRWNMSSAYTYLGCIYNPAIKEISLPDPVSRNVAMDQVEIVKDSLRVRTYPTLKDDIIGLAHRGFYDVMEKKTSDGYTWYRVGECQWMAGVKDTLIYHPSFEVGSVARIKKGTPVRITYRKFAYECDWIVEKELGKRVLLKHPLYSYHINTKKECLM